jgi:hypothetical protein
MKELYEKGPAIHSAPSLALLPRGTQRSIDRGIGGVGIELRKFPIRTPTTCPGAEGNMARDDSASPWTVLRNLRPQTRLETSCTRTGRPRGHLMP